MLRRYDRPVAETSPGIDIPAKQQHRTTNLKQLTADMDSMRCPTVHRLYFVRSTLFGESLGHVQQRGRTAGPAGLTKGLNLPLHVQEILSVEP